MSRDPIMVALDPSTTAFGWCAVEMGATPVLVGAGVIETKAAAASKRGSVAEDDARRARFILRALNATLDAHDPAVIAVEAAAGSKSAKVAKALGIAQAVATCAIDAYLGAQGIYVTALEAGDAAGIQRTQRVTRPKGEKKPKGESDRARKARKAAIAAAVVERFGAKQWRRVLGINRDEPVIAPRFEGAFDAAAVALAAWERPEVAAVRALFQGAA